MHVLAPQFGKSKAQLIAISDDCVRLSWEEPEFPGSPVIEYQVYIDEYDIRMLSHVRIAMNQQD